MLTVLPTGRGKFVRFQVPALAFDRLTILVSPLVSLMQDKVAVRVRWTGKRWWGMELG